MTSPKLILIVDDDPAAREELCELLSDLEGVRTTAAAGGEEAWRMIRDDPPAAALIDLRLPDISGIELLKRIRTLPVDVPSVIVTGAGSIESGVEAIKLGAHDYILKPFQPEKIRALARQLADLSRLREENASLREEAGVSYALDRPVGKSPSIRKIYGLLPEIAQVDSTVLIRGESGTGKELIARAIHAASPRRGKAFIIADCTALTESLLESELFGHEKGAFTGAIRKKIGRFEQAQGGTIFLDEIGSFPPSAQLKLLRFLQERKFERVGGEETIVVDVRVIAATNQDLERLVREGRFREDLFYRVNVIPLFLPPLRERREDILLLARHFLGQFARKNRSRIEGIAPEALRLLIDHRWPGNIRELQNAMERAVVVARGKIILPGDLPPLSAAPEYANEQSLDLREHEKRLIERALSESGRNISLAAKKLGITRTTLYGKLKKFGLSL
jgi:DNA-binding NtrC family response regulator